MKRNKKSSITNWKLIFTLSTTVMLLLQSNTYAQCNGFIASRKYELKEIEVFKNMLYSDEYKTTHLMDIYAPPLECDSADVMLMIHGGSFATGSKENMTEYANSYASCGFFVGNINYCLGLKGYKNLRNSCDLLSIKKNDGTYLSDDAWYMAVQDARAALLFMLTEMKNNGVYPRKIHVLGVSAGAITALNLAMVDSSDIDILYPKLKKNLGSLNANVSSEITQYDFDINTVHSISGTLSNIQFLTEKDSNLNVQFFHAINDNVVPYNEVRCSEERVLPGSEDVIIQNESKNSPVCIKMLFTHKGGHGIYAQYRFQIEKQILININEANTGNQLCSVYEGELETPSFTSDSEFEDNELDESSIKVFPNPASTFVGVEFNSPYPTLKAFYQIIDMQGNVYQESNILVYEGYNYERIPLYSFQKGSYIMRLNIDNKILSLPFIKL